MSTQARKDLAAILDKRTAAQEATSFHNLVVRQFIGMKRTPAQIADATGRSTAHITAILRHNRIPLTRGGRGPRLKTAAPKRST